MSTMNIKAVFLPKIKKFRIDLDVPGKGRWVELKTISRFLRETRRDADPIVVGGVKVHFEGPGGPEVEQEVRGYLRTVARCYVETRYKKKK